MCEPDELLVKSVGTPSFMAPEMCAGLPFNGFQGERGPAWVRARPCIVQVWL